MAPSGDEDVSNSFKKEKEQDVEEFKLECENETLKKQLEKLGKLTVCEGCVFDLSVIIQRLYALVLLQF